MGGYAVDPWKSLRRTLGVAGFGWLTALVTAYVSYLALRWVWVPIAVGVVLGLAFVVLLILLHRAAWIGLLSIVPALFILVGAVQYAPEAALEARGVREAVVVVADSATGKDGKNHRLTLRTADGEELEERFTYNGSGAPRVGERLDVMYDPEGVVPMEQADEVDAAGRLGGLIAGLGGWTLLAVLAGWRGHVRRRRGKTDSLLLSL